MVVVRTMFLNTDALPILKMMLGYSVQWTLASSYLSPEQFFCIACLDEARVSKAGKPRSCYSTPALESPKIKPAPSTWPRLVVANSSGTPKLFQRAGLGRGRSGPWPGFRIAKRPTTMAKMLQVIITMATLVFHSMVAGTVLSRLDSIIFIGLQRDVSKESSVI